MNDFRFVALPPSVAHEVRRTRRDAWGNVDLTPVRVDREGAYPCRACLEDARPGEDVILFSYSPFDGQCAYRTVGPIFIHEKECTPLAASDAIPELLAKRLLALRAYDEGGRTMVDCAVVEGREMEAAARRMLGDPRTSTIHVHNARPGCFACVIERK